MVSVVAGRAVMEGRAGQRLKEARLARRLSVDDVAVKTRIPPKQLRALEEGNLAVFSAEIYAKGAYTKYAAYLGIDSNDAWYAFLRTLVGARANVPLRLLVPTTWLQRALTPTGMLILIVGLIILLVASYIGWQILSFVRVPSLQLAEPVSAVVEGTGVLVKGKAEADAEVTINGEGVLLNEANEFESRLPVQEGINVLQVQAIGAGGRVKTITRHLLVPRGNE